MVHRHRSREEDHGHAVEVGGGGPHGNERIHVRRAVAEGLVGANVELAAGDELHRRGQGEHEQAPPFHQEVMGDGREVHQQHDGHRGDRQPDRQEQHPPLPAGLLLPHLPLHVQGLGLDDLVPRVLHRLLDLGDPDPLRIVADGEPFGRQVDRGGEDAVQSPHRLLDRPGT